MIIATKSLTWSPINKISKSVGNIHRQRISRCSTVCLSDHCLEWISWRDNIWWWQKLECNSWKWLNNLLSSCKTVGVISTKYRWAKEDYDDISCICAALTNFCISFHHLGNDVDAAYYNLDKSSYCVFGIKNAKKCNASQKNIVKDFTGICAQNLANHSTHVIVPSAVRIVKYEKWSLQRNIVFRLGYWGFGRNHHDFGVYVSWIYNPNSKEKALSLFTVTFDLFTFTSPHHHDILVFVIEHLAITSLSVRPNFLDNNIALSEFVSLNSPNS